VGPWALAAGIVNTVVGAGIFPLPGSLAACVGVYAPLAYLVCAIAVGAVAICFAEGGSRVPTSGGPYGTIEASFGPLPGFLAGMFLWVSDVLACGGVSAALADVAAGVLPASTRTIAHAAIIVSVVGGTAWINLRGVAHGARLVSAATVVKLVPLAVFLVVGATAVRTSNFASAGPLDARGLGRALILALYAFNGMETPLGASGEVAIPARTIPRALGMAMPAVTLLYVGIQLVATGILGASLAGSSAPLAEAMGRVSPGLRLLMLAGTALSMLGWLGSNLLGSPRLLFAFARDGILPRALGRVHPRSHTPHVAIAVHACVAIALALSGTFAELAVLAALTTALVYIGGCAAAWRLSRLGVANAGEPLRFRRIGIPAVIGILSMLGFIALATRAEIGGLFVLTVGCVILYWARMRMGMRAS
jgi:amino acid transporter